MAISVILISSDSLDESVGSSPSRIIFFDTIPADIPTETPTILSILPTLPHTSPYMYTDSSDGDTSERPPSQDPYEVIVARWRSRVAVRSSPSSSPTHDLSSTDVTPHTLRQILPAPPGLPRRPAVLVLLCHHIPLGRPYRAQPNRIRGSVIASDYDDSTEESYAAYTKPGIDFDVQADIDVDTAVVKAAAAREADVRVEVGIRSDGEDEAEEEAESKDRIETRFDRGVKEGQHETARDVVCRDERVDNLRHHMSYTQEELRHMRVSRYYDRAEFRRTMPTATRTGMTPAVIEEMIERRVAEALEAYASNRNYGPTMESGDEREDDNEDGNGNEPTRLQDAVCMANNIIDQKLKGYAMKNVENKRKFDNNQKDNRGQQPPFKRHNVGGQNVARAYTAGNNERRVYKGLLPLCNKCKFHHEGPYTMRCGKCNKVRHFTRDAREADVRVEVGIRSDGEDEAEEEAESKDRIETRFDRVSNIDNAQREQKHGMLAANERVDNLRHHMSYTQEELRRMRVSRYYDRAEFRRTMPTATRTGMTPAVIEEIIERRVAEALEAYASNRNYGPTMESGDEREDDNEDGNGNEGTHEVDNQGNVARAYTVRNSEKKGYDGSLPYYNKFKLHHEGQCTVQCTNCKKVRNMARDCRDAVAATAQRAQVED
nr:reverse transcriptase domain-containing protein [Tanacetum cinerariifolium]